MKDYRSMTPCERVVYYRAQIRQMSPARSSREELLIATFRRLIDENEPFCRRVRDAAQAGAGSRSPVAGQPSKGADSRRAAHPTGLWRAKLTGES